MRMPDGSTLVGRVVGMPAAGPPSVNTGSRCSTGTTWIRRMRPECWPRSTSPDTRTSPSGPPCGCGRTALGAGSASAASRPPRSTCGRPPAARTCCPIPAPSASCSSRNRWLTTSPPPVAPAAPVKRSRPTTPPSVDVTPSARTVRWRRWRQQHVATLRVDQPDGTAGMSAAYSNRRSRPSRVAVGWEAQFREAWSMAVAMAATLSVRRLRAPTAPVRGSSWSPPSAWVCW